MPPHNSEATHYMKSPIIHYSTLTFFSLGGLLHQPEISPKIMAMVLPLSFNTSINKIFGWEVGGTRQCPTSLTTLINPFIKGGPWRGFISSLGPFWSLLTHILFSYSIVITFLYLIYGLPWLLLNSIASEFPMPLIPLRISGLVGLPLSLDLILSYQ